MQRVCRAILLTLPLVIAPFGALSARADGGLRSPGDLQSIAEVDAAADTATREATNCASLREGLEIALGSSEAILLKNDGGVQVIMPKHVEELVARVRLMHLVKPELLEGNQESLASTLGIPVFALDAIMDGDHLMADTAVPTLMAALRQHYEEQDAAARSSMQGMITVCQTIEESASLYLESLEERRKELLAAGTITYTGDDLLLNGLPLDICTASRMDPASGVFYPCEDYAAQRFCEGRGHAAQIAFKWQEMPRTAYPDGAICERSDAAGCKGFTEITCGNKPG